MAESQAIIGWGLTLGYSDTEGGSYTTMAELTDTGFPELVDDDVEVSHYTSPDTVKEYIAGWSDGSDLDIELNFTKAQHAALMAIRRLKKFFKITFPDASTYIFPGYIKRIGGAAPKDDRITTTATIKVAGSPEFTPGA